MQTLFCSFKLIPLGLCLFLLSACETEKKPVRYTGQTMGTTYNIVVIPSPEAKLENLQKKIENSLKEVNSHLSNWDPNSEISHFNISKDTTPFTISSMMVKVLETANAVNKKSLGFFDITLSPLIDLWGFGPKTMKSRLPSEKQIQDALAKVGQNTKLKLDRDAKTLLKTNPDTQINLSAIAKGFGVDEVARTLTKNNINNFMVEIGGELYARGKKPNGEKWKIGIEKPDASGKEIQLIVKLSNLAMATSGDYRNYFEKNGRRYSHILNAKTGHPFTHKTVSVTVIANNTMLADAWATALLTLGKTKGMEIAKQNDLAVFFIFKSEKSADTVFETSMSPRFIELTTE